jgi:hypothetical protein
MQSEAYPIENTVRDGTRMQLEYSTNYDICFSSLLFA